MTFENFVFQTEPIDINEESEGIDQNTQVRNQGIIALSYRDWEVKLCTLQLSVLGSSATLLYTLCPHVLCSLLGDCEDLRDLRACDYVGPEPAEAKCLTPAAGNVSYARAACFY